MQDTLYRWSVPLLGLSGAGRTEDEVQTRFDGEIAIATGSGG
jgi:hypothetical protein